MRRVYCFCSKNLVEIPSIIIEDMPKTPPMSSRDIASAGVEQSPGSPTPRISHADFSLSIDTSSGSRLQRGSRWSNEHNTYSADFSNSRCVLMRLLGPSHTSPRPVTLDDAQDIVSAMHNTVWGGKVDRIPISPSLLRLMF